MHTTNTSNGTVFIHDGDFGDSIEIRRGDITVHVPSSDLKEFMAHWVRTEKITRLEQADDDDVLGLR